MNDAILFDQAQSEEEARAEAANAYQLALAQSQREDAQTQAAVRELAEAAILSDFQEWEALPLADKSALAAALIRAESPVHRFEYIGETRIADFLPYRIAYLLDHPSDPGELLQLSQDLLAAARDYAAHAGQEAIDQARDRLTVPTVRHVSMEELLDCRERVRDINATLKTAIPPRGLR